jgi:fatty acid synthase
MPVKKELGEEIVISGFSGRFPESGSYKEFQENLFNHVNMVTVNERRFKPGLYGIPQGFGTLKELDRFDAEFFKILPNQAQRMDPQLRIAMETTYEAMLDAGNAKTRFSDL